MAFVQKAEVLAVANGQWRNIVLALCPGLPDAALTATHKPCPKCGGNDRFRCFDNFDETGGAYCSGGKDNPDCHTEETSPKSGDGLAFLQWWNGWNFVRALNAVAAHLGIKGTSPVASPQPASSSGKSAKKEPKAPAKKKDDRTLVQRWKRWEDNPEQLLQLTAVWAETKEGVSLQAAMETEHFVGNWPSNRSENTVLAYYGYQTAKDDEEPTAIMLYRQQGGHFPILGALPKRKTHMIKNSINSWVFIGGKKRFREASVIWKVEGIPDGLALLPLVPDHHAIVTGTNGGKWNRRRPEKMPSIGIFKGKAAVIALPHCDTTGRTGAEGFCHDVQELVAKVFSVNLPYTPESGKDGRDWVVDFRPQWGDEKFKAALYDWTKLQEIQKEVFGFEAPVGSILSNHIWAAGNECVPKTMPEILSGIFDLTNGWPRRVGDRLFIHEDDQIRWLNKAPDMFAWVGRTTKAIVDFARTSNAFGKEETFAAVKQGATGYKSIEVCPHEPRIPDHYYACNEYPSGEGSHLKWLLDRFSPETEVDRDLILLMFATLFWGGSGGQRPAFLVTANGRGAGKTTLAEVAAELAGGLIDVDLREDGQKIKQRILTAEGRDKRVILIDNIKAVRVSHAALEALITAPTISGHELYHGESQRPNTLLWILTMNGVGLSRDIAQRIVMIKLRIPEEYSATWESEVKGFVKEFRDEIISDLIGFLRKPSKPISNHSRWGSWEHAVLSKLPFGADYRRTGPDEATKVIMQRQGETDVDSDESGEIETAITQQIMDLGYDDRDSVFFPSIVANQWYNTATNERNSMTKTTQILRQQIEEGSIKNLEYTRHKYGQTRVRGFIWYGDNGTRNPNDVRTDLKEKQDWKNMPRIPNGDY